MFNINRIFDDGFLFLGFDLIFMGGIIVNIGLILVFCVDKGLNFATL